MKVALPPVRPPVPSDVLPSLNVTMPAGVPAPGLAAVTVAVKVMPWPKTDGLAEEETVVVVLAREVKRGIIGAVVALQGKKRQLRIVALDLHVEIMLQGQLDGFLQRQLSRIVR